MKRQGDFYSLTDDIAQFVCCAPVNIHTAAVSAVAKTTDFIKNMPISSNIKNRCLSSGRPLIVEPIKGRTGCPEEGCWAWWNDARLVRYPDHIRMSIDEAQNQGAMLDGAEQFSRDVLGYVEVVIPRRPIPSATVSMLLQAGLVIEPAGSPIEVAAEHVPAAVFQCPASGEPIPLHTHRGECLIHCNHARCIKSWPFDSAQDGCYPVHDSTGMEEHSWRKTAKDFR